MAIFDYNPSAITPFPYWRWNKVLPAVYDDSVSQYEMLCRLLSVVNNIIESTNSTGEQVEALTQLVQQLIDGEFPSGIVQYVTDIVNAVIEDDITSINETISQIKSLIPSTDFSDELTIKDYIDNSLQFDNYTSEQSKPNEDVIMRNGGGVVINNKTYGTYEHATAGAVMAGGDTEPDVLGSDTIGLATYLNRDSVALFTRNNMQPYTLFIPSGISYSSNGCTLPTDVNMENLSVGMVLDSGERSQVNSNWYVGIISDIDALNHTISLEDGWFLCRNDGGVPIQGTPPNTNVLYVSHITKLWGQNTNIHIPTDITAGCCHEYKLFNTGPVNDAGIIDCVLESDNNINYGVRVRSVNSNHPVSAFQSIGENSSIAFAGYSSSNNKNFDIDNFGHAHGLKHHVVALTSQTAADLMRNDVFILTQGSSLILPKGEAGASVIVFVLATSGCTITSPNSTAFVRSSGNVAGATGFPVTRANNFTLTLISDGNSWYVIE